MSEAMHRDHSELVLKTSVSPYLGNMLCIFHPIHEMCALATIPSMNYAGWLSGDPGATSWGREAPVACKSS